MPDSAFFALFMIIETPVIMLDNTVFLCYNRLYYQNGKYWN